MAEIEVKVCSEGVWTESLIIIIIIISIIERSAKRFIGSTTDLMDCAASMDIALKTKIQS